jgi:formate hydrogenlyase subunit 6/NADH:ubiquinone oxidoreductase subunit I
MSFVAYLARFKTAAQTIVEGMAVTFSHLLREPITVQYPDRTDRPVSDTLPARYRGLLEVQMDICTGCKWCERACPIDCIAIDLAKNASTKKLEMTRFDIDMGKCMYCGLCVEACVRESTGAIRHTREFEGAGPTLDSLVFRFVGDEPAPLYKAPKDPKDIPVGEYGPHAREARERAMRDNHALLVELREAYFAKRRGEVEPTAEELAERVHKRRLKLAVLTAKSEEEGFAALLETLTPQTDCGACGYPTCRAYAAALASGRESDARKCTPGGPPVAADLGYVTTARRDGFRAADEAFGAARSGASGGDESAAGENAAPTSPGGAAPAHDEPREESRHES